MPRAQFTTLVGLIDSDEDLDEFGVGSQTVEETMAPAKKPRIAAPSRVTKSTRAKKAPARNILTEKTGNVSEEPAQSKGTKRPATEEINALENQDVEDKPRTGGRRIRANKARKIAGAEDELSEIQVETMAPAPVRRGRKPKMNIEAEIPETQEPETEIAETQPVDMADIITEEYEQIDELPTYNREVISSVQRHQPRNLVGVSRRPVSASDSELNDPALRRRIGEITRKYDILEAKYRDLREIGVHEAERSFDRLKKQGEERANSKSLFQ
jgi:hypothetical protein